MLIKFNYKEKNGKWSDLVMTSACKTKSHPKHVIKCGNLKLLKAALIFPAEAHERNILETLKTVLLSIPQKMKTYSLPEEFVLVFFSEKKIFELHYSEKAMSLWRGRIYVKNDLIFSVNKAGYKLGKSFTKSDAKSIKKHLAATEINCYLDYLKIFANISKNILTKQAYSWFKKNKICIDYDYSNHFITEKATFKKDLSKYDQVIKFSLNTELLDLGLIRKDEIWFHSLTEDSSLRSLAEYIIRDDLEIRRGYVQGRFGYLPIKNEVL